MCLARKTHYGSVVTKELLPLFRVLVLVIAVPKDRFEHILSSPLPF